MALGLSRLVRVNLVAELVMNFIQLPLSMELQDFLPKQSEWYSECQQWHCQTMSRNLLQPTLLEELRQKA